VCKVKLDRRANKVCKDQRETLVIQVPQDRKVFKVFKDHREK
jgi:hypothetical protein